MRSDGLSYEESANIASGIAEGRIDPASIDIDEVNLVPEHLRGLDRYEARKKVVEEIEAGGLSVTVRDEDGNERPLVEDKKIMQPMGDRSHVVIEPMLTDQWFVRAGELAKPAIEAVESGRTRFVPANWDKTYFQWMRNIEPWCISRQLWWGHRIPAWHGPDGEIFVAHKEEEARALALEHYGEERELKRDPDVLDTWFSSALWAFSTLGWPDETEELKRYYPTDVLVTGFDIIFFWVARMMMMGLHFMNEVPFHTVYVHALVRDENGAKMSKSKGNVIDPLDIVDGIDLESLVAKRTSNMMNPQDARKIEKATRKAYPDGIPAYGADALRFTLAAMAAQGRDVRMSLARVEGYRNFATKLWNAARFTQMNECVRVEGFDPASCSLIVNRWIGGELERAGRAVAEGIENHRYNEAAGAIYHFIWHVFCDWYLELCKSVLNGLDGEALAETRAMTAYVLDQILKLLHPFMPFITEELWRELAEHGPARKSLLIEAEWPILTGLEDEQADREVERIIELVSEVRSLRSELNIAPGLALPLLVVAPDEELAGWMERHEEEVRRLARLESFEPAADVPHGAAQGVIGEMTIALPLAGVIDVEAESERLAREIDKSRADIDRIRAKLDNENFISRAPAEVVEEQRRRKSEAEEVLKRLQAARERIQSLA
jgi:valyl-tRNA synthetase